VLPVWYSQPVQGNVRRWTPFCIIKTWEVGQFVLKYFIYLFI